jgi:urease accessory protein
MKKLRCPRNQRIGASGALRSLLEMDSPFPKSSSKAGVGHVLVKRLPNGVPALESITYQYPLKLISPSVKADQKSVLVFLLSYGGGLVGGDQVDLHVDVRANARLSIVTQGHTKIFKPLTPGTVTRQKLEVKICEHGALCLLPDPVQPFEGSNYEQTQIFHLSSTASLVMLDWVTHGRAARGENWDLLHWKGRNEIWATEQAPQGKDRLLVRDTVILDGPPTAARPQSLQESMYGHAVFGTLLLRGPLTKALGAFFLSEFGAMPRIGARDFRTAEEVEEDSDVSPLQKWRASRSKLEKQFDVLWSAAQVRGCVVVKFGASTVEAGRQWICTMLMRESSVSTVFGDDALMCLR